MKLITHNMLKCNTRGVNKGYPLLIQSDKYEIIGQEFNLELMKKLVLRLNWDGVQSAITDMNIDDLKDFALPPNDINSLSEDYLRKLHHVMFEIHVIDGYLICPESGRKFPIKDGIPNMLLHEDEV